MTHWSSRRTHAGVLVGAQAHAVKLPAGSQPDGLCEDVHAQRLVHPGQRLPQVRQKLYVRVAALIELNTECGLNAAQVCQGVLSLLQTNDKAGSRCDLSHEMQRAAEFKQGAHDCMFTAMSAHISLTDAKDMLQGQYGRSKMLQASILLQEVGLLKDCKHASADHPCNAM